MSLRLSLICLVAIGMGASLLLASVVAAYSASHRVRTEMRAAVGVALRAAENVLTGTTGRDDPLAELRSVVAAFDGNRHVRLRLAGTGLSSAPPPTEVTTLGAAPALFARLIAPDPPSAQLVVALGDGRSETLVIQSDPQNEIGEAWEAFCATVLSLLLFCAVTFMAIHVFVGRALRPLDELGEAFRAIGRGDFTARDEHRLAPELARLYRGFNDMAGKLTAEKAENRRLGEKLLTLQEAERRDIARDLHDEFGPCLFAVKVDAAAIVRLAEAGRTAEIPAAVQGISEAASHMQEQVRSMLGRLRPAGLDEFGLEAALGDLVTFWRRRQPGIDYRLQVDEDCEGIGDLAETTVYRVVQEALSNAVRHGSPTTITVRVSREGADRAAAAHGAAASRARTVVEVVDDGSGTAEVRRGGFGLLGMAERVQGLGGTLETTDRSEGGFLVRAVLPPAPGAGPAEHAARQEAPVGGRAVSAAGEAA
ncbi:histidine kinase [Arenibaculum pallidiluteum]|uniref:histidine kinase n=1 Tax=Arenibaculum pallidiluteum TaxID=2812559 RepID=UPI001F249BF0|nr:histidine kinase [Arenibaculum pallidiluteum]